MQNIILIVAAVIIGAVIIIAAIPVERESKRRLQRYWDRHCTGADWLNRFPNSPKDEIRRFLQAFAEGFAFKDQQRLKFAPDDKVMDVYRALYPSEGWLDSLEIETFSKNLQKEYNFDLAKVTDPDVTLGQLFEMIRNAN
jgi:propanediol dehydratase small subunit